MKLKSGIKKNNDEILSIKKSTSKMILNMIIKNENIDYEKLNIIKIKKEINTLKKLYLFYNDKLKNNTKKIKPRYFIFWRILQDHYKIINFDLVKKKKKNISEKSKCKSNVVYSCLTKLFGFNPSLISICLCASHIKNIMNSKKYLLAEKVTPNFHSFEKNEKKEFFNVLDKGEIQIISPICPDYEYKKIGKNIFSFTFNTLNSDIGLPGNRIINEISNVYRFLKSNDVTFIHNVYYGDFEAFSEKNCSRLKISKELFINKLSQSVKKLKKKRLFNKVGFFVDDLSNMNDWQYLMKKNRKKIDERFKNNLQFKEIIFDILNARKNLYLNWFPKENNEFYLNVLLHQGAEYASMGDIIHKKFSNPLIIAADHPKMKYFYNLNRNIGLAYLKKVY